MLMVQWPCSDSGRRYLIIISSSVDYILEHKLSKRVVALRFRINNEPASYRWCHDYPSYSVTVCWSADFVSWLRHQMQFIATIRTACTNTRNVVNCGQSGFLGRTNEIIAVNQLVLEWFRDRKLEDIQLDRLNYSVFKVSDVMREIQNWEW